MKVKLAKVFVLPNEVPESVGEVERRDRSALVVWFLFLHGGVSAVTLASTTICCTMFYSCSANKQAPDACSRAGSLAPPHALGGCLRENLPESVREVEGRERSARIVWLLLSRGGVSAVMGDALFISNL